MNRGAKAARFAGPDSFRLGGRTSLTLLCGFALLLVHAAVPAVSAHVRSHLRLPKRAAHAEGISGTLLARRMLLQSGNDSSGSDLSPESPPTADTTDVSPVTGDAPGTPEVWMLLLLHVSPHSLILTT